MDAAQILREQIMKAVSEQIQKGEPPEAIEHYQRLQAIGWPEEHCREMLGQCLLIEIAEMLEKGTSFQTERYRKNLANLPSLPRADIS